MDLGEPRKHVLGRGAHWHNPANVIEPFKCGGDVASLSDYFDHVLWSPYGTGQTIIFSSCGFFLILFLSFFPRLISAVADWMSTMLLHMVWP